MALRRLEEWVSLRALDQRVRASAVLLFRFALLFSVVICLTCVTGSVALSQDGNAPGKADQMNVLYWLFKVSGVIGIFIFALSVYFVAVSIKQSIELRMSIAAPPDIVEGAQKLIEQRKTKDLMDLLKSDDSYFSKSLIAGISELRFGIEEAREKLDRKAETLTVQMERSISVLAVIGTLGPMIGLLGTLKGMISSFSVIAMSGVALDAAKVAEGISEALVLTFEGVLLSVPAIFLYSVFKNRIAQISVETTMLADDCLRSVNRLLKLKPLPEPPA
ncbi:MAG: MotA/TolQ/ExbB proton channel family protein [Pirellula sp.]